MHEDEEQPIEQPKNDGDRVGHDNEDEEDSQEEKQSIPANAMQQDVEQPNEQILQDQPKDEAQQPKNVSNKDGEDGLQTQSVTSNAMQQKDEEQPKEQSKDDRNDGQDHDGLQNLVMAATGFQSMKEIRRNPGTELAFLKTMQYAKDFLNDEETDHDQDIPSHVRDNPEHHFASDHHWHDMHLHHMHIGGERPTPPVRRGAKEKETVTHFVVRECLTIFFFIGGSIVMMSLVVVALTFASSRIPIPNHSRTTANVTDFGTLAPTASPKPKTRTYAPSVPNNFIHFGKPTFNATLAPVIATPTPQTTTSTPSVSKNIPHFGNPVAAPKLRPVVSPILQPTTLSITTAPTAAAAALSSAPTFDEAARFEDIMSILVDAGFAEESKLRNGITAQSKALDWLVSNDPAALNSASEALLPRYVLGVLFYSTSGREPRLTGSNETSWKEHNQWLTGENYCQWHGIKCMEDEDYNVTIVNGDIFEIDLSNNDLSGTIPSELQILADLQLLDLRSNQLQGTIPQFEFPKLQEIHLDNNRLNGPIALHLESMKELRTLSMGHNALTGGLPSTIGIANKLRYLKLKDNHLSGTLPAAAMANLKYLENLHISYNRLSGSLFSDDEFVFGMMNLVNVSLSHNSFSGTLSGNLSQLSHLQELHLTGNTFSGTLPDCFGNMTRLAMLHLGDNLFSGEVPVIPSHQLQKLDISKNSFIGTMPQEICDLKQIGKLTSLKADCSGGDTTTALDLSSFFGNNRRKMLSRSLVEELDEDEEIIEEGDYIYLEEDGTVEDKDGNIIEGIELGDLEVAGDQLNGGTGDLPEGYLYTGSAPIAKPVAVNKQTSIASGDERDSVPDHLEDIQITQPVIFPDERQDYNDIAFAREKIPSDNQAGTNDNRGGIEATAANKQAQLSYGNDDDDDNFEMDDNDTVNPNTAYAKQRGGDEQRFKIVTNERVPSNNQVRANGSRDGIQTTSTANLLPEGFECSCCTYCLAKPSSSLIPHHGMPVELPQDQDDIPKVEDIPEIKLTQDQDDIPKVKDIPETNVPIKPANRIDMLPVGEEEPTTAVELGDIFIEEKLTDEDQGADWCALAIRAGTNGDKYPGFVGMNAKAAKACLEANTDRAIVMVREIAKKHFPFENNRIILYVDDNGNVVKVPVLG
ncbi:unnamed protein product [Cylindrotheca closterium]|uniref:Uncharacterized protein n=1 Tax=Cylindrotheca closterium TaxID=2856 RepID=A0AAD2GDM2_9STRA|nr:unnamed protein product [Cylindrotheca closterium]